MVLAGSESQPCRFVSQARFWLGSSPNHIGSSPSTWVQVPIKIWSPAGSGVPRIPTGRGAWWATVHRVAESQTRLKRPSSHTSGGIDEDQLRYFSHGWLRGRGQTAPESEPRASGLFPCYLVTTQGPRKQQKIQEGQGRDSLGLRMEPDCLD